MATHKNRKANLKVNLEEAIDQLEDMWDKMLAKGDDDFYETAKHHRNSNDVAELRAKSIRKKGRKM